MTTERVLEILEHDLCYERKTAAAAAVEGESAWAFAHTYGELLLEHAINKIKEENNAT